MNPKLFESARLSGISKRIFIRARSGLAAYQTPYTWPQPTCLPEPILSFARRSHPYRDSGRRRCDRCISYASYQRYPISVVRRDDPIFSFGTRFRD